jgi:integrase/recombinase XerD
MILRLMWVIVGRLNMTITEAFAAYESRALMTKTEKTRRNYRSIHNSIIKALDVIPLELIGDEQLTLWNQYMAEDGCTGTTRRGSLMKVRKIINYFRRYGVTTYDPSFFEMPAEDTPPRVFLSAAEVQLLINAAKNDRDKAIIACTFLSGCRISEILNLNRDALKAPIDPDGLQEITVKGKNGKYRQTVFNETARMYLENYLDTRQDNYTELFISGQNRRITVSRVEQIVHQCARDARLEKVVTPHTLRHSYATDLLNNKAPMYEVSKSLGHKNISTTTDIYGHYDTQTRKATIRAHQSQLV